MGAANKPFDLAKPANGSNDGRSSGAEPKTTTAGKLASFMAKHERNAHY